MQRHNSKASVGSVESCRAGEKKEKSTHMIIQREGENDLVLLPISHLVNGQSARMKQNDRATFKIDLNNRKQERGTIVLFGSEEVCIEQMQVLTMSTDDLENGYLHNEQINNRVDEVNQKNKRIDYNKAVNSSTTQQHHPSKTISTGGKISAAVPSDRTQINCSNKNTCDVNKHTKHNGMSANNSNNNNNKVYASTSNKEHISSTSTNDYLCDSRALSVMSNTSLYKSKTTTSMKMTNNNPKKGTQSNRHTQSSSPLSAKSSDEETASAEVIDETRSRSHSIELDRTDKEDADLVVDDTSPSQHDFLSKKCNKLLRENMALQRECDRLKKEINHMKKTTIPMPDAGGRQWIVNLAKIFSKKNPESDIFEHAKNLDIIDPTELVGCLQDTTSNTARQVVRLLYTPNQLLQMSGTEIPLSQRKAIREFAEAYKGPISNHKFNEAINGVFRSEKQPNNKKQKDKPVQQPKNSKKGQGTIARSTTEKTVHQPGRKITEKFKENTHESVSDQSDEHL